MIKRFTSQSWCRPHCRPHCGQTGHLETMAGGTGDVAARLAGADRLVTVGDPSLAMLQVGQRRGLRPVGWLAGTGEQLPLASGSVDTLTIAFGIRNVTHLDAALREALRVLEPGGRFLCLEFSTPVFWLRPFCGWFSQAVIPRLGAWIARSPAACICLIESIRRFPDQRSFKALIERAGVEQVHFCNLSFGIACIHSGTRSLTAAADRDATAAQP